MLTIKEKDKKVLEFIRSRIELGYPPSVREICSEFGFKSTATAQRAIQKLIELGYIEKLDHKSRTLKIVGRNSYTVPLVGTVTAGTPITAIEEITDYLNFNPPKNYHGELFALKIKGESMINAGIFDGDIIVAEKTSIVSNGEIAVILCDGEEATVKRFYKENGHFRLQPENDNMEDIITQNAEVIGKVVGLTRYF